MKRLFFILAAVVMAVGVMAEEVRYLTQEEFREKIFDYQTEEEWLYKGTENVVIDCYYTWCGGYKPIDEERLEFVKWFRTEYLKQDK